jgi:putative glutamine amidotransferase
MPVTLPQLPEAVEPALDRLDGLVLAPGRDIDPARYGEPPGPLLAALEPRRDEFEFALALAALARGRPVLGICRGMQVLNVALGGTMVQDVRLVEGWREHPSDPGWRAWKLMEQAALADEEFPDHPRHPIAIATPGILASALGGSDAWVNLFHHQAIGEPGQWTPSHRRRSRRRGGGELDGCPVLGVQWELQDEWRIDARFTAVFDWFVAAAGARVIPEVASL